MVNTFWFYADCIVTEGEFAATSTYLLSRLSQITDLLNNSEVSIKSLYLVSPPDINGTSSWQMDSIARISLGEIKHNRLGLEIYELANGRKIYSSDQIKSDDCFDTVKVIYATYP